MFRPPGIIRVCLLLAFVAVSVTCGQSPQPSGPVALDSTAAFRPLTANWQLAGGLGGDPRRDRTLTGTPGTGVLVCNPGKDPSTRGHLFTAWEHGDIEVELEFLMAPGSNSGVYLQGRYEVQLFDSWGVRAPTYSDCGGIYQRWDPARGKGKEGYEGIAPRANAARAPGLWQQLQIAFEAPRFDADGRKTRNARFTRVMLNGILVHENVEVTGPTRSAAFTDERPLGPLMVQGDHGPVALRRLAVKRFHAGVKLTITDRHYRLYAGNHREMGAYDGQPPTREGAPARFGSETDDVVVHAALVPPAPATRPSSTPRLRPATTTLSALFRVTPPR